MTKLEKLEHLYEGHSCSNSGHRGKCSRKGICKKWIDDQTVYEEIMKELNKIMKDSKNGNAVIQTILTDSYTIIAKEMNESTRKTGTS